MASTLVVDTTQLHSLGSRLNTVRDQLANTANQLSKHEPSLGAPSIATALHDFEDHWGRGRRQLTEKADALAQMLTDSASNYTTTDADVADALSAETGSV